MANMISAGVSKDLYAIQVIRPKISKAREREPAVRRNI
jgi:hypothetical protein